jgi:hypothetical protein
MSDDGWKALRSRYLERTRCLTRIRSETARQLYPNEIYGRLAAIAMSAVAAWFL